MLLIVCGLPGTGKTTIAKRIAKELRAGYLSTDRIRKKLIKQRKYSENEKTVVYREMFDIAEQRLKNKKSLVLDGTFYKDEFREKARAIAKKYRTRYFMIECVLNENELERRIKKRNKKESVSEADFLVYLRVKKQFQPIKEKHLVIECGEVMSKRIRKVIEWLEMPQK